MILRILFAIISKFHKNYMNKLVNDADIYIVGQNNKH